MKHRPRPALLAVVAIAIIFHFALTAQAQITQLGTYENCIGPG